MCIAYHGVGRYKDSESLKKFTGLIIDTTFKKGQAQFHSDCGDQYNPWTKSWWKSLFYF